MSWGNWDMFYFPSEGAGGDYNRLSEGVGGGCNRLLSSFGGGRGRSF